MKKTLLNALLTIACYRCIEFLIFMSSDSMRMYEKTCLWLLVYLCIKQTMDQ